VLVVEREERGLAARFDRQDIGHVVVPGEKDADGCGYSQLRLLVAIEVGMTAVTVVFLAS
jgi:hypothetical protein